MQARDLLRDDLRGADQQVVAGGDEPVLAVVSRGPVPDDLASLPARERITVGLRARGRTFGTMTLALTGASGRRYRRGDEAFAAVLGSESSARSPRSRSASRSTEMRISR